MGGESVRGMATWLVSPVVAALVVEHRKVTIKIIPEDAATSLAVELLESYKGTMVVTRSKSTNVSSSLLLGALVRVKITPCGRGAPEELGVIYFLRDEEWKEVGEKVKVMKGKKAAVPTEEKQGHESVSPLVRRSIRLEADLRRSSVLLLVRATSWDASRLATSPSSEDKVTPSAPSLFTYSSR